MFRFFVAGLRSADSLCKSSGHGQLFFWQYFVERSQEERGDSYDYADRTLRTVVPDKRAD